MGFLSKKQAELPPLLSDEEIASVVTYDSALQYLVGLSIGDYAKMLKVVNIYRAANKDAAKALGIKAKATTKIEVRPDGDLEFIFDETKPDSLIGGEQ